MKQCATCNQIVNDTESYCPRCGGRKFKAKNTPQTQQIQFQSVEQEIGEKIIDTKQKVQKRAKGKAQEAQQDARRQTNQAANQNQNQAVNNPNRRPPQALRNQTVEQDGFVDNANYDTTVTWKEYLFLHLWCLIPLVGVIIFVIKLFKLKSDVNAKPSMREYAKFQLIMFAAGLVLCLLYFIVFGLIMGSILGNLF